jgi:hypothetical protein
MTLSKSIHKTIWAWLLTAVSLVPLVAKPIPAPSVKLEVLAVRILSNAEAASRSPDFLGPNVAVRLRLSNPTSDGIYFYTWERAVVPQGYKVKQSGSSTVWLYGKPGQEPVTSPGLDRLTSGLPGVWVVLPPNSAIEWEELDSTSFGGEKHAFTCFLKRNENDSPIEIFSEWFDVPKPTK